MSDPDEKTCRDCGQELPFFETARPPPFHRAPAYHDCPKGPDYLSPAQVEALQRQQALKDAMAELLRLLCEGKMPESVAARAADGVLCLGEVLVHLKSISEGKVG